MENLNDKVESILQRARPESAPASAELQAIEEQRRSTLKCLQICAKLSAHLEAVEITPDASSRDSSGNAAAADPGPASIMNEGVREWQDSLRNTTKRLNDCNESLIRRMVALAKTGCTSSSDAAEILRIETDIESNRRFLDICYEADRQAKKKISQIDNFATGDDNVQFLGSTDGNVVQGKNRLFGLRNQQLGGHIDGTTLQKVIQTNARIAIAPGGVDLQGLKDATSSSPEVAGRGDAQEPGFDGRYGNGHKLSPTVSPKR